MKQNIYEEEFYNFMRSKGIFNDFFENYIKERIKRVDYDLFNGFWGCFPIVKDNILIDIKLLVPNIIDKKTVLINIHEFMHARRLFSRLGKQYIENVELEEEVATNMEKVYLKNSSI